MLIRELMRGNSSRDWVHGNVLHLTVFEARTSCHNTDLHQGCTANQGQVTLSRFLVPLIVRILPVCVYAFVCVCVCVCVCVYVHVYDYRWYHYTVWFRMRDVCCVQSTQLNAMGRGDLKNATVVPFALSCPGSLSREVRQICMWTVFSQINLISGVANFLKL